MRIHEIIDEIYVEDIVPYHEFERVESPTFSRPGSHVSELDYLEIAKKFVQAVVESAVAFGAELVTPGGVENYQKFEAGKISSLEYTNLGARIGEGLGGAAGFAMAGGSAIPGAAAGSTAGAAMGTAISRAGAAISRTLNKEKHDSTILMDENHSKSASSSVYKGDKVLSAPTIQRHHIFPRQF